MGREKFFDVEVLDLSGSDVSPMGFSFTSDFGLDLG